MLDSSKLPGLGPFMTDNLSNVTCCTVLSDHLARFALILLIDSVVAPWQVLEWASKIRVSVDLRPAFFMFY